MPNANNMMGQGQFASIGVDTVNMDGDGFNFADVGPVPSYSLIALCGILCTVQIICVIFSLLLSLGHFLTFQ